MLECLRPSVRLHVDPCNIKEREGEDYFPRHRRGNTDDQRSDPQNHQRGREQRADSPAPVRGKVASASFRVHACWVRAGHDLLHERTPFFLSLLHKVS